jgi:dTDP-4-amino-4,6-dideoxygalactose transaminase
MKIHLVDLAAQHRPLRREIVGAIERVLDSSRFILGPEVERLEERIATYSGARFAVGVSSGTDALLVGLMALGIGQGDEVITSAYSFFATAGTIARLGATPVFVDIDPATYNIDPALIEPVISPRTKAIVPVHLFGQCAEMAPITQLAAGRDLAIVEDAAQAIGAEYRDGRRAGSIGQFGCLSFFPSKNLGALGDAGMVLTNDAELAEKVRALRVHGSKSKYHHSSVGGNFRLDEIQAAVLNVKLDHLDAWTAARQQNARHYVTMFKESAVLSDVPIGLPVAAYAHCGLTYHHIYNQFVIRTPRRDELRRYLAANGIDTEIYYSVPLHLQECFRYLGYRSGSFPVAESAAAATLAIPVDVGLNREAQAYVVETIANFFNAATH